MSDIEDQGSFRASRSIPTEREDGAEASSPSCCIYERISSVRVGNRDLLDHLLILVSEEEAVAAIEELACLVRRPLTKNVLDLVQFVLWALDNDQTINDDHILALVDAIKDTRNPHVALQGAA